MTNPASMCDYDFQLPHLDIKGFVVDYFSFRIEKDRLEWHERPELPYGVQPEHKVMRRLASIFERRHTVELDGFANELLEDEHLSFARYCDILEEFGRVENEEARGMSYGRLVGIIAFGGVVAARMMQHNLRKEVQQIFLYTSRFVDARIRLTWPTERKSWKLFMTVAADIIQRDDKSLMEESNFSRRRWSIVIGAALVGIGAIIGTKTLMSK
ncbi:unnamed protein product [Auanema sp. JU1783]|nr:unnamed protein product [Auanema sp. JU1783]